MLRILTKLLLVIVIFSLAVASPRPARAGSAADAGAAAAWTTLGVTSFLAFSYLAWKNRPANQDKVDWSPKGPGGFYVGAYMGASFVHSDDWHFDSVRFPGFTSGPLTASTIKFAPGVVGGLKLGYFFHSLPFFGVELESSFNRSDIRKAAVRLSRSFG
ncbi:MAG: hypothetical protein JRI59_06565 [Deltaproteobacteria bacterium]|nr:hypothetical protein [Deltaproteobacteria bacterium]